MYQVADETTTKEPAWFFPVSLSSSFLDAVQLGVMMRVRTDRKRRRKRGPRRLTRACRKQRRGWWRRRGWKGSAKRSAVHPQQYRPRQGNEEGGYPKGREPRTEFHRPSGRLATQQTGLSHTTCRDRLWAEGAIDSPFDSGDALVSRQPKTE